MKVHEIIAREWRDENGIIYRREVGQELVRCKECKHHFYDELNDCKMCYIHEYGEIWEDDDYCSDGEREGE